MIELSCLTHVLRELIPCTLEVQCFDAAARWCYSGVVDHNRNHVMPESVVIEFLRNVIIADRVLECYIEFILFLQVT